MLRNIKRNLTMSLLVIIIFFTQCMATQVKDNPTPAAVPAAVPFAEDMSVFPNPERGWYRSMETNDLSINELMHFRDSGITLVAFETNLAAYLNKPLDAVKLNEVDRAFAAAHMAGLEVIFRAAYDFNGRDFPDPKDINIVLNHIHQLGPIFQKYADVLFNIQAGFLGSWGEWHTSNFGPHVKWTPVSPEYQRMVVDALLEEAPVTTTVSVRRPEYVRNIAGKEPLTAEEAFSGSKLSRVGFHNDALMSEKTDMDTYIDPDYPLEKEFAWINNHTRYTPFIAETNTVSSYNDIKNAVPFLDLMNADSLNYEYHPGVLKKWHNSSYNGMNAYDYITLKLGYRIVLRKAEHGGVLAPGGNLHLNLELENTGFGHILREKIFELVLKKDNETIRMPIKEDARFWNKNEPINRAYDFKLPADMSAGNWNVYLGLSSAFDTLRDNPAYSVRFANTDVWDGNLGLNKIGVISVGIGQK